MSPELVGQLADAIFRRWPNAEKLMGILGEAYLDSSETGNGRSRAYTLSCLVAPSVVWEHFSVAWAESLKCSGAEGKIVHMKNLVHRVGEWEGWTKSQERSLFEKLIVVIRQYKPVGFCYSLPLQDFEETTNPADEFRPFELLLDSVMLSTKETFNPTKDNPVVFFMEQDRVVEAGAMQQFFHRTAGRGWTDIFPIFVPLPKGPEPLQLADMLVYEGSRFASEHVLSSSAEKPRKLCQELASVGTLFFGCADRQYLIDWANEIRTDQQTMSPEQATKIRQAWKAAGKRMQQYRDAGFGVKRGGK